MSELIRAMAGQAGHRRNRAKLSLIRKHLAEIAKPGMAPVSKTGGVSLGSSNLPLGVFFFEIII